MSAIQHRLQQRLIYVSRRLLSILANVCTARANFYRNQYDQVIEKS